MPQWSGTGELQLPGSSVPRSKRDIGASLRRCLSFFIPANLLTLTTVSVYHSFNGNEERSRSEEQATMSKTYETTIETVECMYCYGAGKIAIVSGYSREISDSGATEACTHCGGSGTFTVTITAEEWRSADEWMAEQEAKARAEDDRIAAEFARIEAKLNLLVVTR